MKSWLRTVLFFALLAALLAGCQNAATQPGAAAITADNAAGLAVVRQTQLSAPYEITWSPDGSALLILEGGGAARLDARTLKPTEKLEFEMPVMFASTSPDGETLAYSEDGSRIAIKNIRKMEAAISIDPGETIGGLDFSPDGQTLLANSMEAFSVLLWDAGNGSDSGRLTGFETAAPVYSVRFGEDGNHILWIARGTAQSQQITGGQMGPEISHEDFISDAALSPDGKVLAAAAAGTVRGEYTPALFLWDAANGDALGVLPYSESFGRVAFSPDGQLIAASNGARITIWDVADPKLVAELDSNADIIRALAFSPDGATLASAAGDGTLALWQVK